MLGWQENKCDAVYFSNTQRPLVSFKSPENNYQHPYSSHELTPDLELPSPRTSSISLFTHEDLWNSHPSPSQDLFSTENCVQNLTVAKIDEVLTQIDDIKKSIVDIDTQLFQVTGSKCATFNPDFFTLTHGDLDLDDTESGPRKHQEVRGNSFQDKGLEWDPTDVQDDHFFFSDDECFDVDSALSLPVTDADKQKLKSMQELLEDAQQLGLLNNLLEALSTKAYNRDSAYFE